MMINLTKIPQERLTDWHRELLRRGWVWLIEPTAGQEPEKTR
jgi:hypothetical protein